MITVLDTCMALAIPWYAGMLIVATLFPRLPLLGRIGIGWGVGLGGVTWLMFSLSLAHIPFTGPIVGLALLLCVLAFAWRAPRFTSARPPVEGDGSGDPAPTLLRWIVSAVVGFVLVFVTVYNLIWPVRDWDALAAYDLRARAFVRFGTVAAAAHHGNLSYSFGQQPFTSFGHTWFYETVGIDAPVKLLYSSCFAALIAAFICFVTRYRSETLAYLVLPGLLLSPLLDHAMIAYTNLPSAYGVFVATWASYETLRTGERRWCLLAGFMWGFAIWTRQSLEPFVSIGIVALCVPWLRRRVLPRPALAAVGLAILLGYAWPVYAHSFFWAGWRENAVSFLRLWMTILALPVALSLLVLAFTWAHRRALQWHLLGALALLSIPSLYVAYRLTHHLFDRALFRAVYDYLHGGLWPLWGPLLLVFTICWLVGIGHAKEHTGYVAIFVGCCAAFVVSTYGFALVFPLWQGIPGSAVRHSYAILPIFWAAIGIMPGTAQIVEAFAALRPAGVRLPATQGD